MKRSSRPLLLCACVALLQWSANAFCQVGLIPIDVKASSSQALGFVGKRLDDQALRRNRGGTQVLDLNQPKSAVVDNIANNVTTGSNQITGGALSGASGVPVVVQNSGNNVLIQSSTVIHLNLK